MNDRHPFFSAAAMDVVRNAVAGGTASLLAQTVVVPVDILSQKQMMITNCHNPSSIVALARDIFAREGFMGFYRGFFASVMVCSAFASLTIACNLAYLRVLHHASLL